MSKKQKTQEEANEESIEDKEIAQEANPSVLEEAAAFVEKKKQLAEERAAEPKAPKAPREPITRDTSSLDAFKNKLISEFGLTEKTDSHGCIQLKLNNFNVIKLLPRKGMYGVWREDPTQENKYHSFRVNNAEDEKSHYDFVKEFVKINSEEKTA